MVVFGSLCVLPTRKELGQKTMPRFEKFTEKSQEALQAAAREASGRGQQAIEPEHLLLALLTDEGGLTRPLLEAAGGSPQAIQPAAVSLVERLPRVSGGQSHLSNALTAVLERAEKEAEALKDEYISTEHLLLAMADLTVLKDNGVTRDGLLQALKSVRGNQRVTDPNPESKYQALERYGRDLTALAASGKLDPVIGRDEEIRRVIQVLSRRTKNNPVLIGEPGVGKTARARGTLRAIGATTLDEYRKHIEKDAALERRFQPIFVGEPSVEDTISILRGLRDRYEVHHGVRFKDSALVAAAVLSHRYISDRFLPDKAIDLIDEAAARLRMEIDSMPSELDELEGAIRTPV